MNNTQMTTNNFTQYMPVINGVNNFFNSLKFMEALSNSCAGNPTLSMVAMLAMCMNMQNQK